MKRASLLRTVIAVALTPMLFAGVASAQSHGGRHGGNGNHNAPNGSHAANTQAPSRGDHDRGGSVGRAPQHFNGGNQRFSGGNQRFSGDNRRFDGGERRLADNNRHDNGDRLRGNDNRVRRDRGRDVVVINRGRPSRPSYGYGYRSPRPYYYGPGISLGIGFGYNFDTYYAPYYDSFGLYPGECRWDYRRDYWTGRPADVALQICADRYGRVYVVGGTQRWVGWR